MLIAGEHEDCYDPDFQIYNDVVVLHPDGRMDILGYPREIFPPTDFHSATLVGEQIFIIGGLSYPEERQAAKTRVYCLKLQTSFHFALRHLRSGPGLDSPPCRRT